MLYTYNFLPFGCVWNDIGHDVVDDLSWILWENDEENAT